MRRIALSFVIFAAIITAASARQKSSPPAAVSFDSVREFIKQQLTERSIPSIAVAVARDRQIIWEEAFGWADRENRVPTTPHTMYSLASISKPITATGLMILKERGRIDLDRPINEYLGEAKITVRVGNPAEATVRRMANHTAGLPLYTHFYFAGGPDQAPSRDETIRRYGISVTAPGERYQYSNLGYGILDYVIERVSGRSYADFMREEVFLPLGLTRTSVDIGLGLEKHQAVRYDTEGLPIPFYYSDHPGASAVYASAHDLVRFGMFHVKAHLPDQKAILKDETIDEMQKAAADTNGYGIGWSTSVPSGWRGVWHTGAMSGVSTMLYLDPVEKITIVVLSNASSDLPFQVGGRIVAALSPQVAGAATPQNQPPSEPVFKPSSELLGTWQGRVHTHEGGGLPFMLVFQPDGDIHARMGRQLRTLLNRVEFKDGYLRGSFNSDIGTEDANRRRYELLLSLKLRGDSLNGGITARSQGKCPCNALTHWVELKKVE